MLGFGGCSTFCGFASDPGLIWKLYYTKDPNPMLAQRMMWIAWPAFLLAGVIEMLVFALVDPQSLHWAGQPLALSREAVYTLAFFVFWLLTMMSSALTTLLSMSPFEINRRQLAGEERLGQSNGSGHRN